MQPLVELSQVSKSYDGTTEVVRALDLEVAEGEFLTLLGPSGSGKTTILMMLAGFELPTSGDIRLGGRSIAGLPPHKRDIGVVFQHYALFPHMSVAQNVGFPLEVRKVPKAEAAQRVERALEMVQLGGLGARRPHQLSGGQRQRVALARALVFEPRLVLMDEPLGALDKQLREHMQLEIKHLHARLGLTVVYVTHDQSEALTMSDRVAVFDAGRIQQLATPAELYEAPGNAFVASFIGESNRLEGRVLHREGGRCTVEVEGLGAVAAVDACSGERAIIALRPERVRLGEALENAFEGEVLEHIFHGDHHRLRLRLGAQEDFVLKLPNAAGAELAAVGSTLRVGWRAEDARALEGES